MGVMEVAGITISAISFFFEVFSRCVKGIQLIQDIRDVPEKYKTLLLQFELEQNRLMCWGGAVGLFDEVMEEGELNIKIAGPIRSTIEELLGKLWCDISLLVTKKPNSGKSQSPTKQKGNDSSQFKPRFNLDQLFQRALIIAVEFHGKVLWATSKAVKLENLLHRLRAVNDNILSLTEDMARKDIFRTVTSTYTEILILRESVGELRELIEALDSNPSATDQTKPIAAIRNQQQFENQQLSQLAELKVAITQQEANPASKHELRLDPGTVYIGDYIDKAGQRWNAKYNEESNYWVEWKEYERNEASGPSKKDIEGFVIKELVSLLSVKESTTIRVPRCIGYFDDHARSRFGLVFKHSEEATPDAQLTTLAEQISTIKYPGLADRIELARALVITLHYLHSVGWLHKALRPQNIIFFKESTGSILYGKPYISGFDYARPAPRPEMTQVPANRPYDDFYRHPSVQSSIQQGSRMGYRKTFDIYSLAVVLIEVAIWKPIRVILEVGPSDKVDYQMTKNLLLGGSPDYLSMVGFAAGRTYQDLVRTCLLGWDELGRGDVDETQSKGGRLLMVNFENMVIKKLQSIQVAD